VEKSNELREKQIHVLAITSNGAISSIRRLNDEDPSSIQETHGDHLGF
jgi:hypothetical protein